MKLQGMLLFVLPLLLQAWIAMPSHGQSLQGQGLPQAMVNEPPLPGANSISGLQVRKTDDGGWMVEFDYFYTGSPRSARLSLRLGGKSGPGIIPSTPEYQLDEAGFVQVQRGAHHVTHELQRPVDTVEPFTSRQVVVELRGPLNLGRDSNKVFEAQQVDQLIDWPHLAVWNEDRRLARMASAEILKDAVHFIDLGELQAAKRLLNRLIARDARYDPAYIELARIAMKSNWGPEGLHQAETLIQSALRIRPDSANAKILLGYVYAHQERYQEAEDLLADAARSDPPNLWLWANWGEVLVMQGKVDLGIEKYLQAVTLPRTSDANDRARLDAYERLIALFEKRSDMKAAEEMYKQRAEEFDCSKPDYGRVLLRQHGDAIRAIALARTAVDRRCPGSQAHEVLGLAYYSAWADADAGHRDEYLNQAHAYLPMGPRVLILLAASERTARVLEKLIAMGESIDQLDNRKWTALSLAVLNKDYEAVARLARLGARMDKPVGPEKMPVAMLPVVVRDLEGIRLMRKLGVNYSNLDYQGVAILDQIRRSGDRQLIDVADSKAGRL